jgi:hypothetical protein
MNILGVVSSKPCFDEKNGVCEFSIFDKGIITQIKVERLITARACFKYLKEGSYIKAVGEHIENYFLANQVIFISPGVYNSISETGIKEVV